MLVKCAIYRKSGKLYGAGQVEIDVMPWEDGVLKAVIENQEIVNSIDGFGFIVLDDIPESHADPNYRMTYARLYKLKKEN